jgi:hypothetical protein
VNLIDSRNIEIPNQMPVWVSAKIPRFLKAFGIGPAQD